MCSFSLFLRLPVKVESQGVPPSRSGLSHSAHYPAHHTKLLLWEAGRKGAGEAPCGRADFWQDFSPPVVPEGSPPLCRVPRTFCTTLCSLHSFRQVTHNPSNFPLYFGWQEAQSQIYSVVWFVFWFLCNES